MRRLARRGAALLLVGLCRGLTGVRALWLGSLPAAGARVYFANHASHLDGLVIWAALPPALRTRTHPVAARDYWDATPLRRWLALQVFGAVLIDRQPATAAGEADAARADVLAPLLAVLERGEALILFPEGTRGDGETVQPFRSGLWQLAQRCPRAELIPVHLENLNRVLPKGSMLPVPLLCAARFGARFLPVDGETRADYLERARQAVLALAR
ncbi:MAG TPA: lysophospholipid acyltransferase family protein [Plasticicumulans sp.]|uniref:lysophospholipid acyltransferase family protein n=1 Tax=Plasticicumulans sp. TaxID=2307179 RepID=UPI000FB6491D|nr:lysophospholipid acyltransferase family protein [Plasticicumulans sp.]MBS0602243.1 1-acyl-sn-glycerol-3-phosphate acyltransferase [Pseudomonadota bacterium]RTK98698.1 MAG: 1-acyl-sn-glycerol-3-phosphate acyltransferase [Xanthomonadales bacterium]HMV39965.1 lysophospholipid acyltransferase family protein [Plasticicumulans sp.]HMW29226.1 lysophospholipid acyltransferase family protein [Plasticicumulans sp.]HMW42806.1 lysophospholipid acyltransferase family protein [Plasticicumulans sp.]